MITYVGYRSTLVGETSVYVVDENGARPLPWRLDLMRHSPTGLEWGYGGSGPAQLALAIVAHHLGVDEIPPHTRDHDFPELALRAIRLHQDFKFKVIGGLSRELEPGSTSLAHHRQWELTTDQVEAAIRDIEGVAA